jgi:predicted AlkP superfamily phosphohydrolase/phosphomutase
MDRTAKIRACLLLLVLALAGCRGPADEDKPPRLVLIGLDGASWKMIGPMAEKGELPHLKALMDRGVSADLGSVEPLFSPPVWTSVATGRSPKEHGVDFFYANRFSIKVPTMWERFAGAGLRVGLYDYLVTWPPQELPGGFVVPGWLRRDESVWPADLFDRIGQPRYAYKVIEVGGPEEVIANVEREIAEKPKTWNRLWKELRPDVGAVTFYALDVLGHRYWHTEFPQEYDPPAEVEPRFAGVLSRTLRGVDGAVGEIVDALAPGDHVVIVSDHGFKPGFRSRRWGFDTAWLLESAGIDPRRDGLTVVASWFSVSIRVNPGPAAEREAMIARLQELFSSVRAPGGDPVFNLDTVHVPERPSEVKERHELRQQMIQRQQPAYAFFFADPVPGVLDRIAREGTVEVGGARHPAGRFAAGHDFSGDHDPVGVFLAAGGGIRHRPGRLRLSVLDVAPLMTYLAGQPIPDDYERQLAKALIDPEWLERHPPRPIAASQAPRLQDGKGGQGPAAGDKELEERLRALGYI